MRNLLIILIVIAALGAGIYYFTKEEVVPLPANETQTANTDQATTTDPSTSSGQATSTGTNVGVDVGVTVGTPATKSFTISGSNFSFDVKSIEVNKGDKVKITFKNAGGNHDLQVEGYGVGTKTLSGGASETITFVADKAGSFEYYCSVGSHRQMGMKGTLTVK